MKYPKAGDLQRATSMQITSNPAQRNPYEVRSASGLEGVFADKDDAEFHAAELRREGVQGVSVENRRRPSYADRAVAARALREEEQAAQDYRERAAHTHSPGLREVYEHAGEEEQQHAAMLRPFARNPSPRLFAGIYPSGVIYADRYEDVDGDYKRIAFLPFSTLQLEWAPGVHPPELVEEVTADAAKIIARRGEDFEVSASGQTVKLGNPGPRVLREKWGDASDIVIERHRHGISGWLESKRGGGRLPISFGAARPETLREAMELAKKFLRSVHGRSNPAGLTAKGERMYEDIKRGYEERGEPRAKEIAARTVQARAHEIPGLKKKRR